MKKDALAAALDGFRQWIMTAAALHGDRDVDVEEMELIAELLREICAVRKPADLAHADLSDLLLRVYPEQVSVADEETIDDTIPALRDFTAFLADRGDLDAGAARALDARLAGLGPQFRAAMIAAMDDADADGYDDAQFDADEDDDPVSMKEAFGLPDELPPLRLPSDDELARHVREAPMIRQLVALAGWAGDGRPVTGEGTLDAAGSAAAVEALGLADESLLPLLWDIGIELEFLDFTRGGDGGDLVVPGVLAEDWDTLADADILDTWESVFGMVLAVSLDIAQQQDAQGAADLDFDGQGAAFAVMMFLSNGPGFPVSEASAALRESVAAEFGPVAADQAWRAWVTVHGDPVRLLLDRLEQAGAVTVSAGDAGEVARLTPLGLRVVREQFEDAGVAVPLLPPPDQMSAAQLLDMADAATPEQFEQERRAWFATRPAESAARDLLEVAAVTDPPSRLLAVSLASELGAAAVPVWHDVLDQMPLRGYAKATLAMLAGDELPDLSREDIAWMLTDALVVEGWDDPEDQELDPDEVAARLAEAVPPGKELEAFEMMARVPHPAAPDVLTVIGRLHPDKAKAKAARKAAYQASTRRAAASG